MLTDALESLKKDGTFTFPEKIRPANERFASLCLQALKNANNAASEARSILLSNSRDELRKLLEAEGIKPALLAFEMKINDAAVVTEAAVDGTSWADYVIANVTLKAGANTLTIKALTEVNPINIDSLRFTPVA